MTGTDAGGVADGVLDATGLAPNWADVTVVTGAAGADTADSTLCFNPALQA